LGHAKSEETAKPGFVSCFGVEY